MLNGHPSCFEPLVLEVYFPPMKPRGGSWIRAARMYAGTLCIEAVISFLTAR